MTDPSAHRPALEREQRIYSEIVRDEAHLRAMSRVLDVIFGEPTVQPKTFKPEPYDTPERVSRRLRFETEKLTVPLDLLVSRAPGEGAEVELEDGGFFTPQRRERIRAFLESIVEDQMAQREAEGRP